MVCCMCDSPAGCCCGVCGVDEELIFRQKQREKLMESVRRLKGLSRASRSHLALDPVAVVETARMRTQANQTIFGCLSIRGPGTCSMLLWLCVYGITLYSLRFRLIDHAQVLPKSMWIFDRDSLTEFTKFFPLAVWIMMAVLSASFFLAALSICELISTMTAQVIAAAREELRIDVCESIDHDFYEFVRRLRSNFVICEDFTASAIRKAHRRLHSILRARISLLDADVQGPFAVRREVDSRVGFLQFSMIFGLFFMPWLVFTCFNLVQILMVYESPPSSAPPPRPTSDDKIATPVDLETILSDDGFSVIASSLLINLIAVIYLSFVQSSCVDRCFTSCLYPRVHRAVVDFCNRLVSRTWDESVVEDFVDFLEEPRTRFSRGEDVSRNMLHYHEDTRKVLAPPTSPSEGLEESNPMQQRLLTAESCGPYPTPHQRALEAPSGGPRSNTRSQCLALEPFTLLEDSESCPGGLSGYEGQYFEMEDDIEPSGKGIKVPFGASSDRGCRGGTSLQGEKSSAVRVEGATNRERDDAKAMSPRLWTGDACTAQER